MESSTEEIEHLRRILAIEKNTDFTQFREMVRKLPLNERKLKGYSWYPLRVTKTGFAIGDKAYVILERSGSKEDPNQFRSGMQVTFFTQAAHVKNSERSGIIQFMTDMSMKVILNTPDLPDWINAGSLGIDLDFDERSYLEMEKALLQLQSAKNNRSAELRDILLGYLPSDRAQDLEEVDVAMLNPAQNKAVNHILATRDISILHGPPGTGKTTTLVQGIREMAMRENEILVSAPSNTAVDLLTEKLAETGLNVVRIGNISRVDETILHHTLDYRLAHHPETRQIKKVRIEAIEARKQLEKLDGKFGAEVRDRKSELRREARDLQSWANRLENQLVTKILFEADVITCTLVGSANKVLEGMRFTTVFIDEAAQALEPATWIPILKSDKVVLAGDPYQLPPTVKSIDAQRAGLNVTLIEKAIQRLVDVQVLDIQYRMHVDIMGFS
ncbi:MAG: AAA domain-containing protein, partial [Saprospiraceae bacterium]